MNLVRFLAADLVTGASALGTVASAQYQVPKPTLEKIASIGAAS
jgi:hypothetical protein